MVAKTHMLADLSTRTKVVCTALPAAPGGNNNICVGEVTALTEEERLQDLKKPKGKIQCSHC